jgi:hypothetical protein
MPLPLDPAMMNADQADRDSRTHCPPDAVSRKQTPEDVTLGHRIGAL